MSRGPHPGTKPKIEDSIHGTSGVSQTKSHAEGAYRLKWGRNPRQNPTQRTLSAPGPGNPKRNVKAPRFAWWLITISIVATGIGSHSFLKYSTKAYEYGFSSTMSLTLNRFLPWIIIVVFPSGILRTLSI